MDAKQVRAALRSLRMAGLKQVDVAKKLGVTPETVSRWKRSGATPLVAQALKGAGVVFKAPWEQEGP